MLLSLQTQFPETWRDTFQLLAAGFTWVLGLSATVLNFALFGSGPAEIALKAVLIVLPCFVLVSVVMSWWDWLRMTWFYWAGLLRFVVVLLGWVWGLLKLAGAMFVKLIKFIFTRPLALMDWATRQYFQPGVPWLAFLMIVLWAVLEATIFTFTLRPLITEVRADLTGGDVSPFWVTIILWPFLVILIAGSFAAIQALTDAIATTNTTQIVTTAVF